MRSILLHIADDESLRARTQAALDLASAFGRHLTCLQAAPHEYGVLGGVARDLFAEPPLPVLTFH